MAKSVETRLAALERGLEADELGPRTWSHAQLIMLVAHRMRTGSYPEDPEAVVGPPRAIVRDGEPTAAELIMQCRRRGSPAASMCDGEQVTR